MNRVALLLAALLVGGGALRADERIPLGRGALVRTAKTVEAVDDTGKRLWIRDLVTTGVEVIANGQTQIVLARGRLDALDATNVPVGLHAALAFGPATHLLALDPATGHTAWIFPVWWSPWAEAHLPVPTPVVWKRSLYRAFWHDVFAHDLSTGVVTRRLRLPQSVTALHVEAEALVVTTRSDWYGIVETTRFTGEALEPSPAPRLADNLARDAASVCPEFARANRSYLASRRLRARSPSAEEVRATASLDLAAVAARYAEAARLDPTNPLFLLYQGLAERFAGHLPVGDRLIGEALARAEKEDPSPSALLAIGSELGRLSLSKEANRALELGRSSYFRKSPVVFAHGRELSQEVAILGKLSALLFQTGDEEESLKVWALRRELTEARDGDSIHAELLARWLERRGLEKRAAEEATRAETLERDPFLVENGVDRLESAGILALTGLLTVALLLPALLARLRERRPPRHAALPEWVAAPLLLEAFWLLQAPGASPFLAAIVLAALALPAFAARLRPTGASGARIAATHAGLAAAALGFAKVLSPDTPFGGTPERFFLSVLLVVFSGVIATPYSLWLLASPDESGSLSPWARKLRPVVIELCVLALWFPFAVALAIALLTGTAGPGGGYFILGLLIAILLFLVALRLPAYRDLGTAVRLFLGALIPFAFAFQSLSRGLEFTALLVVPTAVLVAPALWLLSFIRLVRSKVRGPELGLALGCGAGGALFLFAALRSLATVLTFPAAVVLQLPPPLRLEPTNIDWVTLVVQARTKHDSPTLALAEGLSRQLRGEDERARAAYRACAGRAPCATNLAVLDCPRLERGCLAPRLSAALALPGDHAAALYDLGLVDNDASKLREAEMLAPRAVAAARRYRPGMPLLASPDEGDLVRDIRGLFGSATTTMNFIEALFR